MNDTSEIHLNNLWIDKKDIPEKIRIFDTTLRDGEQTPGVALTHDEKVKVAEILDDLKVDTIEAGFPIISKGEKEALKNIVSLNLNSEICALARSRKEDIDAALDCDVDCIHLFIATSDTHLKYKLKINREEALERALSSIDYVKDHGLIIEYSAEDATRTDLNYLKTFYKEVQKARVNRINVPDTVGVMLPINMYNFIKEIKKDITIPISVHCHNDMGLAVANSLAAMEAGAEQIHVTVNGLGERAGNAALEEIVVATNTLYNIKSNIDLKKIGSVSKFVSQIYGIPISPTKAVVGANAFTHESGIHVHGILESSNTYEPFSPDIIGMESKIAIGKHTGGHALKAKLEEYGFELTEGQIKQVLEKIKEMAENGKEVNEYEVVAMASSIIGRTPKENRIINIEDASILSGLHTTPTATITLKIGDEKKVNSKTGVGPVDAALNTLSAIFGELEIEQYKLEAITGGSDSLCKVTIKIKDKDGKKGIGKIVGPDIIMTSINAAVEAMNRIALQKN